MATTHSDPGEAQAFLWPLRIGAVVVAGLDLAWEIARPPVAGVTGQVWTARLVSAATASLIGLLVVRPRPAWLLRLLGMALLLDVVAVNAVIVRLLHGSNEEAAIIMIATMLAGATFAPWSWPWQALLSLLVTPVIIATLTAWSPLAQTRSTQAYLVMAALTAALVSVLGSYLKSLERQRLFASEERYRGIFQGAGDAIAVLGPDGAIRDCNPSLSRLLGLPLDQLLGRRLTEFLALTAGAPDDAPLSFSAELAAARFSEASIVPGTLVSADGGTAEVEVTFSKATTNGGVIVQAMLRDLTEHHALERRRADQQRMDAIARISAGLAHQFNNLLSGILTNAELMKSEEPGGEHGLQLGEIADAARRGRRLTKSLARYTGHEAMTLQHTAPDAILAAVAELARVAVPAGTAIHVDVPGGLPLIAADADQLVHACYELAVNAGHALQASQDAALCLEASTETVGEGDDRWPGAPPGAYVRLTVADNGAGMDDATRRRVFEPFFSTRPMGEAAGLGLATVVWVVRAHQGFVRIDSSPGSGTKVHLLIPVARSPALAPAAPAGPTVVLVVDDESIVRNSVRRVLERLRYRVIEAEDGDHAVAAMKQADPPVDLVLLDIVLPGGGAGLLRRMRELRPEVRVLVSSGYGPEGEATKLIIEGADGFLQKPYEIAELKTAVEAALSGPGR